MKFRRECCEQNFPLTRGLEESSLLNDVSSVGLSQCLQLLCSVEVIPGHSVEYRQLFQLVRLMAVRGSYSPASCVVTVPGAPARGFTFRNGLGSMAALLWRIPVLTAHYLHLPRCDLAK